MYHKKTKHLEFRADGEFIIVALEPERDVKSKGGIILTQDVVSANKQTQTGRVISVGQGRRNPNNPEQRIVPDCKVGDHVLFAKHTGYPIDQVVDGDVVKCMLMKHHDVLAYVEETYELVED